MEEQGRRVWKAAHVGSPQTLDVWWYQINVEPPLKFPPSANSFSLEWNVNLQPSAHYTRLLLQNQEQHHQPNGLPNFQNIPPSIHVLIMKKETFFAIKKSVGNFKSSCNEGSNPSKGNYLSISLPSTEFLIMNFVVKRKRGMILKFTNIVGLSVAKLFTLAYSISILFKRQTLCPVIHLSSPSWMSIWGVAAF